MTRRPLAAIALLAAAAAVAAGCGATSPGGLASKSPPQILAAAKAAADSASSVHLAGAASSGGSQVGLDLVLVAGQGGSGSITQSGVRLDLVVLGGAAYIKAPRAFWRKTAGTAAAAVIGNRWLKASTSQPNFSQVSSFADFHQMMDQFLGSHGPLSKGPTSRLGGIRVVPLHDATQGGTLYVAADGAAYPLALAKTGSGSLTFTDWNRPARLIAPAGAIDISALQGK